MIPISRPHAGRSKSVLTLGYALQVSHDPFGRPVNQRPILAFGPAQDGQLLPPDLASEDAVIKRLPSGRLQLSVNLDEQR